MNAFEAGKDVEQRSLKILRPFIQQRAYNGHYVVTSKGPLARELQRTVGDVVYNWGDDETVYSAEIKAEEANNHDRFFLETWSNRSRFTPGWMLTLSCDVLLYHFLREDELYVIPFGRLRKWAFHDVRIYQFQERCQKKRVQLNDTWGRCVPILTLCRELELGHPFSPANDYDGAKDFSRSLDDCYAEVRARKAAG